MMLVDIVVQANFAKSKSEARRLIEQGAIRINDHVIDDVYAHVLADRETCIVFRK